MGLFNHLFGGKKGIAKELVMDDKKRMQLWEKHLSNHPEREKLSRNFNYKNIDEAVKDVAATRNVLDQIEALISPELVDIEGEEKTEKEILADLKRFKAPHEIQQLSETIVRAKQRQSNLLKLFHEIFNVLGAELHLIRLIKKHPAKELLLKLFEIISYHEAELYSVFREGSYFAENIHIHQDIQRIARAIILEEKIEEAVETAEEKFVMMVVKSMGSSERKGRYRRLGEDIYHKLAEMVGASETEHGADFILQLDKIEELMKKDFIMYAIVKN